MSTNVYHEEYIKLHELQTELNALIGAVKQKLL